MEPLLSPGQAARILGVKVRRVHALCREGKLEYVQVGPRDRRHTAEQLQRFIDRQTVSLPKPVDRKSPDKLLFPRKRGDKKKSTGDSLSERKRMKEELRSCR
jgi:excisionase family DNA binding protein